MIREIKKYPDPILKKKAEEVEEITPEIEKLAEDLIKTMSKSKPEGAGLAAPQVGVLKRLITVQTEQGPIVLINPKILKKSRKTEVIEEGCLSLPGVWLKIKRAREVEAEWLDINAKKIKIKWEGLFARILQHEIDHLDGILILDRINPFQKLKIKKHLKKYKKTKEGIIE